MVCDLREGAAMAAFSCLPLRRKLHLLSAMRNDAPAVRAAYTATRGIRALTVLINPLVRRRGLVFDG